MPENEEIKAGDVVCLKSDQKDSTYRRFTVGSDSARTTVDIHWFHDGELKTAKITKDALHKIE
jgi:hypothetical protein